MIEQPLQMRSLPSWLGQGTEQHMTNTKKKKSAKFVYKVKTTHNQAHCKTLLQKQKSIWLKGLRG